MNKDASEAAFDKLMRGLGHRSPKRIYSGYRELYQLGAAVIPDLERRIFEMDWKTLSRPELTRIQGALVSLLHDIDETRSREVIDQLIRDGCHPVTQSILRSILRFDQGNFRQYEIRGLRILESKDIEQEEHVPHYLDRWLANVPQEDLAGIDRLYVITPPPKADYAGKYMPILATVTMIWGNPFLGWKPPAWFTRFDMEHTLYHEIGHHVCEHTFGQDPEQERQANRYAAARLRITHPYFAWSAKLIRRVLKIKC